MRFVVDAQLPVRLAAVLERHGHDAVHVTSVPDGDRTPDGVICRSADQAGRVVVTEDSDFRDSQTLLGSPRLLLRAMTGNIGNTELVALVEVHLPTILAGFEEHRCVELSRARITWR